MTVHGIIAVFCVLGFFLTNDEKLFRSKSWAQVVVSVLATVIIVGADIGLSAYFSVLRDRKRTPIAFQTLIIIYFFLPLPRKYQAIVLGTLVSIIHLLFAGLFLYNGNEDKKTMVSFLPFVPQIIIALHTFFLLTFPLNFPRITELRALYSVAPFIFFITRNNCDRILFTSLRGARLSCCSGSYGFLLAARRKKSTERINIMTTVMTTIIITLLSESH